MLALAGGLLVSACSLGSLGDAYRDASDSMNNVPPAPEAGPWRLSGYSVDEDAPYPNLGDMPPRPADLPSPEETGRQVRALQGGDGDGTSAPTGPGQQPLVRPGGPPPPAKIAPLTIPPRIQ